MAAQSHQFFIHAHLIREDRHFREKSSLVHRGITKQFLHPVFESLTVLRDDLGRTLCNEIYQLQHAVQFRDQIIPKMFPFGDPGLYEHLAGTL